MGATAAPAGLRQGSWLTGAGFPDPAVLAGLAAVAVAAAPWLSRPWRRVAWATLLLIGAAQLITGALLPMQLVLALAAGVTVGAGLLVAFGVPDRRMGPAGVAAALRAGGVPVSQVTGPLRAAKGSRPFEATTGYGNGLFVKVPADRITDQLARTLWREVSRLHQARIAHRSLHGSNIMLSQNGTALLVDFSFAELAATSRQRAIDVAELLTSLAGRIGPDRAAATAGAAIGADGVATAVPLLQPLACRPAPGARSRARTRC